MDFFSNRPLTYDSPRSFEANFSGERTLLDVEQFPSNFIKTSRYNIVTFLPKSLLLQFARYANIYFLCIAIIQSIPVLSPLSPFSAIAPLVFVLGLSMGREGWEDYGRHVSDAEVNSTPAVILKNRDAQSLTWADICVGDYIIVKKDESFPADLIILGSSIESGVCYIETSSLDGEKNLKPKSAILEAQRMYNNCDSYTDRILKVDAVVPSQDLYEFDGSIYLQIDDQIPPKKFQMSGKQLLLRGAFLRNTDWIIGVAVYTGQDTKIMRNADPARVKSSEIERIMNQLILGILAIQMVLSILTCSLSSAWMHAYGLDSSYLGYGNSTNFNLLAFYNFFSYMLLYNTMIPISLIVSLEFVKVFQSYFIEVDEEMYVAQRDKFAKVQTTTINEELGQVEYIFSDKTGTLTCNQMEFKYCVIGDILYGEKDEKPKAIPNPQLIRQPSQTKIHPSDGEVFQHSIFTFDDPELTNIIAGEAESGKNKVNLTITSLDGKAKLEIRTQSDLVDNYLTLLASAHECLVQYDKNNQPSYQGPSPDEITLVDAAAHLGFRFTGASASEQKFVIKGQEKKFQLLKSFEFDSARKRMSVIIRDDRGQLKVLSKGADNIIKGRLAKEQPFLLKVDDHLQKFSRIGLRCLMMACRVLSEDEYRDFDTKFNNLPDGPEKKTLLDELTDTLERNLVLLGATAVEDKLQPLVPETIADLLKANIKVWMLTGDKLETAENIAKSCKLIQGDFTVMRLSENTEEACQNKLITNQEIFDHCVKEGRKKSFLVEGQCLEFLIKNPILKSGFVAMAKDCESVICCRVTPKQKADVVRMIKDSLNKICLAIGDGANDVNMIQAAHIGVGLYGNEGMRAVQSSDFALGEFRCLWRLLLVHGHWSYIRISEMVLYFFYKNMIFTVPQFFFAFFNAFSGQSYFDAWYIAFYNLIFTALPLIMRATFDQDINYRQYINYDENDKIRDLQLKQEQYLKNKFPSIYYIGQQKTIFTIPNYLLWAFIGLVHGMIIFFFTLWVVGEHIVRVEGHISGFPGFSLCVYTSIILIADLQIAVRTKLWNWFNFVSITLLSIVIYIIYMLVSHYWTGTLMEYTPLTMLTTPQYWLLQIFMISVIGGTEALVGQLARELFQSPTDLMQKQVKSFQINLQSWIQKEERLAKQDSFWQGIYNHQPPEEVELIPISDGSIKNTNQQQIVL